MFEGPCLVWEEGKKKQLTLDPSKLNKHIVFVMAVSKRRIEEYIISKLTGRKINKILN